MGQEMYHCVFSFFDYSFDTEALKDPPFFLSQCFCLDITSISLSCILPKTIWLILTTGKHLLFCKQHSLTRRYYSCDTILQK